MPSDLLDSGLTFCATSGNCAKILNAGAVFDAMWDRSPSDKDKEELSERISTMTKMTVISLHEEDSSLREDLAKIMQS